MNKRDILLLLIIVASFLIISQSAFAAYREAALRAADDRPEDPLLQGETAYQLDSSIWNDPFFVDTLRPAYRDTYPMPGPDFTQSVRPTNAGMYSSVNANDELVSMIQARKCAFRGMCSRSFNMARYPTYSWVRTRYYAFPVIPRGSSKLVDAYSPDARVYYSLRREFRDLGYGNPQEGEAYGPYGRASATPRGEVIMANPDASQDLR